MQAKKSTRKMSSAEMTEKARAVPTVAEIVKAANQPRVFASGAIRDTEESKLDFEGFLSPQALEAFAQYMHFHRHMPDGTLRNSDNWQKGIPNDVLMKSAWRHFFALWSAHRHARHTIGSDFLSHACGLMFNLQAIIQEHIKNEPEAIEWMLSALAEERTKQQSPRKA